MKKNLLGLLFLLFSSAYSYGQDYDLKFDYSLETPGNADTLVVGESYNLTGTINNLGPGIFNGYIDFRAYVGSSSAGFDPNTTQGTFNLNNSSFYNIIFNGNANFGGDFYVDPSHFEVNAYNIVIIWPTDYYRDQNRGNDYKIFKVYVTAGADGQTGNITYKTVRKGINNLNEKTAAKQELSKLSFHPNPATDILNVYVKDAERGTLKITDLSGRIIQQLDINGQSRSFIPVQLSKGGAVLPNGVYLINLETENYSEIKKFVIVK